MKIGRMGRGNWSKMEVGRILRRQRKGGKYADT